MQAILDDLTFDDHFSIIDFNHNVRCWSEDLVHGSSIQINSAKKYIQGIRPNGGEEAVWVNEGSGCTFVSYIDTVHHYSY